MNLARVLNAVVLAGDRGPSDPVARATGSPCKALSPVAGKPMVMHTLDALVGCEDIERIIISGPKLEYAQSHEGLQSRLLADDRLSWIDQESSPARSAAAALDVMNAENACLITTADHALLTPELLSSFIDRALERSEDVVVGLARLEMIQAAFPESRRTAFRLRDGSFCGCNLFLLHNARARRAADYWRKVEDLRKKPWRVASVFGLRALFGLASRRLDLAGALGIVGQKIGIDVGSVIVDEPELAVDVDSPEDLALVETILRNRASAEA